VHYSRATVAAATNHIIHHNFSNHSNFSESNTSKINKKNHESSRTFKLIFQIQHIISGTHITKLITNNITWTSRTISNYSN